MDRAGTIGSQTRVSQCKKPEAVFERELEQPPLRSPSSSHPGVYTN